MLPTAESKDDGYGASDSLIASMPAARAEQLDSAGLAARFPGTTVDIGGTWTGDHGASFTDVEITPGPGTSIEALRTTTGGARDGNPLISSHDDLLSQRILLGDVRRGSLVILLAGLLQAAASSAVASAASVVDQRRTIARLALTGVPVALMARARSWQTTLPLVAATAGRSGWDWDLRSC